MDACNERRGILTFKGCQHALEVGVPYSGSTGFKAEGFLEPFNQLVGHFGGEPVTPESQDRDGMHQGAFMD